MSDTPKFYDITNDEWRAVTQADVYRMTSCVAAFGMLRGGIKALLDVTLDVAQGKRDSFDVERKIRDQ